MISVMVVLDSHRKTVEEDYVSADVKDYGMLYIHVDLHGSINLGEVFGGTAKEELCFSDSDKGSGHKGKDIETTPVLSIHK